ncbi:TetR/AcrR family transcriptional regulator [Paenibacillus lemnae]|uniref:TetR/AcrR family transcriptional regulator n=1 Tax=Paenibacillus lemnae TaxID=1330551 RepID=A0A848MD96_PAELE|nr:TetR/AcrR family transcriptional regulator [Paenibacillus lemnae]NMO98053.1 TetR/AcrR family transcriptional regulator [Paenibacillus lemnae]
MSPRTKEQNEAIREMRMSQIMNAAAEVYLEKGIQLEIRDVSLKAELGYGTVYHYYKNKHMLLEDLLWDALLRVESSVMPALNGNDNDKFKSVSFTRLLLQKCMQDPAIFILLKSVADNFHHFPGNRFTKLFAEFQVRVYQPFVEQILKEIDSKSPENTANFIFGSLVGYAALNIHHQLQSEMDVQRIVDLMFTGIQSKER